MLGRFHSNLIFFLLQAGIVYFPALNFCFADPPEDSQKTRYSLGVSLSYKTVTGAYNPYGEYFAYPDGSYSAIWTTTVKLTAHFNREWSASISVPFRDSDQSLPTGTSDSKSIGGPSLSVHYRIDLPLHPTLNAGISLPWRLSWKQVDGQPNASLPQDFSDSSSPTGGSIPFGATIHPQIGPFDFQLEATYTYFFPSDQEITDAPPGYPQATIKPGDKIKFTEEMSYPLTPNWKIGGGFEQTWGDNVQIDGVENLGTASRAVDTILGLDYRIDQQWNMGLKFTTPFPFEQFMVNQTFGSGVTLSVTLSDL